MQRYVCISVYVTCTYWRTKSHFAPNTANQSSIPVINDGHSFEKKVESLEVRPQHIPNMSSLKLKETVKKNAVVLTF